MNRKLLIIIGGIVVAIAGGFAYLLLHDKPAPTSPAAIPEVSTPGLNPPIAAGAYVDYSAEAVAQTAGTKILFFHAAWCPQCRALETDIKAGTLPAGLTIFKVDYDSHQTLRQKYGVRLQTTLVKIDDQGNQLASFVAYDNPSLQAIIENLL